jgi:hypothetical protein
MYLGYGLIVIDFANVLFVSLVSAIVVALSALAMM